MANSSITAFCASKNVLCEGGNTIKHFVGLEPNRTYTLIMTNAKADCSLEKADKKGEKSVLPFTFEHCSSLTQQTHMGGRFDIISRSLQQATQRSTSSCET